MAQQWRLVPGQSLLHYSWDQQVVLFNEVSGSTHLLDLPTLDLLHAVRDAELSAADWTDPALQQILAELNKLYLVEPC